MKKFLFLFFALAVAVSGFAGVTEKAEGGFKATLTEKVDNLIATNQKRLERTYYPRDSKPNYAGINFGYPYMAGINYSYNLNEMFALGVGAGAYFPGYALGVDFKYFVMPTTIAPYVGAGLAFVGSQTKGDAAVNVAAGVDFALETGICINIGAVYMKSFNENAPEFGTVWGDTKKGFNSLGIQAGFGVRF